MSETNFEVSLEIGEAEMVVRIRMPSYVTIHQWPIWRLAAERYLNKEIDRIRDEILAQAAMISGEVEHQ